MLCVALPMIAMCSLISFGSSWDSWFLVFCELHALSWSREGEAGERCFSLGTSYNTVSIPFSFLFDSDTAEHICSHSW